MLVNVRSDIVGKVRRMIDFSMLNYKMHGKWYCVRNQFLLHNREPTSISSCINTKACLTNGQERVNSLMSIHSVAPSQPILLCSIDHNAMAK